MQSQLCHSDHIAQGLLQPLSTCSHLGISQGLGSEFGVGPPIRDGGL